MVIKTAKNQVSIGVIIESNQEGEIIIFGNDADKMATCYINEKRRLKKGKNVHYFALPLSPQNLFLEIKNTTKNQITIQKVFLKNLPQPQPIIIDDKNERIADLGQYLKDVFEFSEKASYLKQGFYSGEGEYMNLQYIDYLTDEEGNIIKNPARTFIDSGNMQIARQFFMKMTVAMRVFVLLHERTHYIFNIEGGTTEEESFLDRFAKQIYEKLNFPNTEYKNLIGIALSDTAQNRQRIANLY